MPLRVVDCFVSLRFEKTSGQKFGAMHHALGSLKRVDSYGSMSSVYSADGGQGDYDIGGSVRVGVWLKDEVLFVRVVQAKGLAGAKRGGLSDPYVKMYLLPDKTKITKRKTSTHRKTNDPWFNEILKVSCFS